MPQLNQLLLVYQSQWFWLLLVLAVIYFGIGRGMVPKIERVVEDRNAKIAGDLAAAERARAEADEAEERARQAEADARAAAQGADRRGQGQGRQGCRSAAGQGRCRNCRASSLQPKRR